MIVTPSMVEAKSETRGFPTDWAGGGGCGDKVVEPDGAVVGTPDAAGSDGAGVDGADEDGAGCDDPA